MQHAARDDGVVCAVDRTELVSPEARSVGRVRVDAESVIAGVDERADEAALTAAAHLDDAARRRRQLL
jgi:hypothetical protein